MVRAPDRSRRQRRDQQCRARVVRDRESERELPQRRGDTHRQCGERGGSDRQGDRTLRPQRPGYREGKRHDRDRGEPVHDDQRVAAAGASLRLVAASGVDYEVRTTVHPDLLPEDALLRLADELASLGVRRWALQPFRPTGCADDVLVAASPRGARIADDLVARLRERVPGVDVRD